MQAQLVEAKSRQNEPSDVSKSQVLKAGQQLQRLQDQLASQADLHRGLERENEMLRKVNQSCKEEAERLLLVIQEKEREEEEEVVRQQQQRQQLHQQQQSKQHGRVLEVGSSKTSLPCLCPGNSFFSFFFLFSLFFPFQKQEGSD